MYSNLETLFAAHILENKRTIEEVPQAFRVNVQKIVADQQKKQGSSEK